MPSDYQSTSNPAIVLRVSDGASIPLDPANRDYQDYQVWVAAGNVPAPAPTQAPSTRVSTWDFLNRFTTGEQLAVQSACATNTTLGLYLTQGLASGSVDLSDSTVAAWMSALVAASAITAARSTVILTP